MRPIAASAILGLLLAACGGSAAPSSAPAPASAAAKPASVAASAPAVSSAASAKPAASGAASAAAKPAGSGSAAAKPAASGAAQANPTFIDGTVASVDASKLTLAEGNKVLTLAPNTSYVKLQKETPADVKAGQFVAITAKQQPDNTLLASFLRLQDSGGGRPANQFPMEQIVNGQPVSGNLMTNAPVKSADPTSMVVTLAGGDVTVKYAPDVQIVHQAEGAASDVKPGSKVLALARGDSAINVGVYV